MTIDTARWIPWLPALASVLCAVCMIWRPLRRLAAPICIASLVGAFIIAWSTYSQVFDANGQGVSHVRWAFTWINIAGFSADMQYYFDPLTFLMLFVVTGIGSLVAIYAAGYMAGDRGYARFFACVSLFIFAMTTLVRADNLLLMYLGWEGVGLCSYLLIGYYYQKPSAVAAAKKAFIVNRIGDLGFALGIMLTYQQFGTIEFGKLFTLLAMQPSPSEFTVQVIPFLLMLGAFGKSAQLPLYVWLPDAMEGPTPVSALIHAATMVTAGVYMIARLIPLFELSPYALPTVAVVGGLTALFAASIALCQNDIKRIYAYSTISQLGYMFLGLGVLSTAGAVFHLFTHAFFKALLFLTAGSVMHSLAGQLDLRHMSGLRRKMPVTCVLMFMGCLALAGFPYTAGFFSKDMILAATLQKGLTEHQTLYTILALVGLLTAFATAFYTFRLWFRVFMGPTEYDMGDEHDHAAQAAHGAHSGEIQVEHHHDAHEVSWLMNGPLVLLAVGALLAGYLGHNWVEHTIEGSSAQPLRVRIAHAPAGGMGSHHAMLFGMDLHTAMMLISGVISISGIALAAYYHWFNRPAAAKMGARWSGLVRLLSNKYYVDEFNDRVIVNPLRLLGYLCFVFDRLIIDGLVMATGFIPRMLGLAIRPTQRGALQGYGLGMAVGVGVFVLLILVSYRG